MIANLKRLRQDARLTQTVLAKMLGTTQQTIARWEAGRSNPSISVLKDIAMAFGCRVDDLLEFSEHRKPQSTRLYSITEVLDGYWGLLGVHLDGGHHTSWFPITQNEYARIGRRLHSSYKDGDWMSVTTLTYRILFINSRNVTSIQLVHDAADPPEDWDPPVAWVSRHPLLGYYEWVPLEVYNGLESWLNSYDNPESWEVNTSKELRESIEHFIEENGLDEESIEHLLHNTDVYLNDGDRLSYHTIPENLESLTFLEEIGASEKFIELSEDGCGERYFAEDKIAMIDVPLISMNNALEELYQLTNNEAGQGT